MDKNRRQKACAASKRVSKPPSIVTYTLAEHTYTLAEHTYTLAEHTYTLAEHTYTLAEHTYILADYTYILADYQEYPPPPLPPLDCT